MKKWNRKQVKIIAGPSDEEDEDQPDHVQYIVIPPDGGWGWFVVFSSFCAHFVVDGILNVFGIFLDEISKDLNVTHSQVAIGHSVLVGINCLIGPLVCGMINRMGMRAVGVLGGFLGCIAMSITSFAPNVKIFIFTYGVFGGFAFCMCFLSGIIAVGFYFERYRAIAISIAVCGSPVGMLVQAPVFNILLRNYTWRIKYKILAGCCFLIGVLSFVYKPIPQTPIVMEPGRRGDEEGLSLASTDSRSIFHRRHNMTFPKTSDMAGANYSIPEEQLVSRTGSIISKFSFKSYKGQPSFASTYLSVADERERTRHPRRNLCANCCKPSESRPMYRDDILFPGSVVRFPQYKSSGTNKSRVSLDYNLSVTRVASVRDVKQSQKCCICCPESVQRTLVTMMDYSLLKSSAFLLLCLSGFVAYMGIFIPFTFVLEYGVSNMLGRLISGTITLIKGVDAMAVFYMWLLLSGVPIVLLPFFDNEYAVFSLIAMFGFFISDMVGIEKLTNAYGLLLLFSGVTALIGVPIGALLNEHTGSFVACFVFAGSCMIVGFVLLLPIKKLMKMEKAKAERLEQERIREESRKKVDRLRKN